jgi:hypothetical protein
MTGPSPDATGKGADIARQTPYELVFSEGDFESRVFPAIRAEAVEHGVDSLELGRFDFLSTAADAIRGLTPEDAPPDALDQYRSLLFHAYHFWLHGYRLFLLDRAVARLLAESAPDLTEWDVSAPAASGYIQLPANLFWSSISPDAPPEPVDGFFFTISPVSDPLGGLADSLQLLMVLGIRRDRAGFSVIRIDTLLDPSILEGTAETDGSDRDRFQSTLPGGDIAGLFSILTSREAVDLALRAFWYMARFPDGAVQIVAGQPTSEPGRPPATRLAHARITLSDRVDRPGPVHER